MRATINVIRLVFLVLAAVTYARPAIAGAPFWTENCNMYCSGSVRVLECTFQDNYDGWDNEPGCEDTWQSNPNHTSCCGGDEFGDPYHEAYARYYQGCHAMGSGSWFTGFSCNENYTRGSFYCSFDDPSCGG